MYSNAAGKGNGAILIYSRSASNESYLLQNVIFPPENDIKDRTYLKFGTSLAWKSDCSAFFVSAEAQSPTDPNQPAKNAYVYVFQNQDNNKETKNHADIIGPIFIGIILIGCLAAMAAFFLYSIHKENEQKEQKEKEQAEKL